MATDSENTPDSEDKDFGFPFVKVEPLQQATPIIHAEKKEEQTENQSEQEPIVVQPVAEKTSQPESEPIEKLFNEEPNESETVEKVKKSNSTFLVTLLVLMLVILSSMAYFFYFKPNQIQEVESFQKSPEPSVESPELQPEVAEIQEETVIEPEVVLKEEEVEPKPEPTKTPVATSGVGNLILVESKGEASYYYMVVASLPNERIAREEAKVFLDQGKDIYMIFPFGNTRNYRLSVGRYSSFTAATDDLAAAKSNINESTWILKY